MALAARESVINKSFGRSAAAVLGELGRGANSPLLVEQLGNMGSPLWAMMTEAVARDDAGATQLLAEDDVRSAFAACRLLGAAALRLQQVHPAETPLPRILQDLNYQLARLKVIAPQLHSETAGEIRRCVNFDRLAKILGAQLGRMGVLSAEMAGQS